MNLTLVNLLVIAPVVLVTLLACLVLALRRRVRRAPSSPSGGAPSPLLVDAAE